MKIRKYLGYGSYVEGISKYSSKTSVLIFDIKETGVVNEEGEKEKSYLLYEFFNRIPLKDVRGQFIAEYIDFIGDDSLNVKLEAMRYADRIYNPSTLEYFKDTKLMGITAYDTSEAVNSFTLNGVSVWYDKATRVSIKNQIESRHMLGQETAPIEFGGTILDIPIELGLGMLAQLEVYASDCYNRTALHKAAVEQLTTKEEVEAYDYTTGYPEKLKFEL